LFRLADGALYWSKVHGRDAACLFDPGTVRELSAQERADALERSQARTGLRGLARAIDAKDPSTRRHSTAWPRCASASRTSSAGVPSAWRCFTRPRSVHDVGKIGVPDAVLLKPGRLTAEEYEAVKQHAALGAQIVDEILTPEQVGWVRHHHERPDGRGYPDGLAGDEIADGARIIALADAFDVMTAARPYSSAEAGRRRGRGGGPPRGRAVRSRRRARRSPRCSRAASSVRPRPAAARRRDSGAGPRDRRRAPRRSSPWRSAPSP
jgi:hypothetical protein